MKKKKEIITVLKPFSNTGPHYKIQKTLRKQHDNTVIKLTSSHTSIILLLHSWTTFSLANSTFDNDFIFSIENIKYKNKAICPAERLVKKLGVFKGELQILITPPHQEMDSTFLPLNPECSKTSTVGFPHPGLTDEDSQLLLPSHRVFPLGNWSPCPDKVQTAPWRSQQGREPRVPANSLSWAPGWWPTPIPVEWDYLGLSPCLSISAEILQSRITTRANPRTMSSVLSHQIFE